MQIGPWALGDLSPTHLNCYYDWAPNVAGIAISYSCRPWANIGPKQTNKDRNFSSFYEVGPTDLVVGSDLVDLFN